MTITRQDLEEVKQEKIDELSGVATLKQQDMQEVDAKVNEYRQVLEGQVKAKYVIRETTLNGQIEILDGLMEKLDKGEELK